MKRPRKKAQHEIDMWVKNPKLMKKKRKDKITSNDALQRERVVRGLVSKILGQHPDFDKKVFTQIIRVRVFARPLIDFKMNRKKIF